jgi:hypothetical protein
VALALLAVLVVTFGPSLSLIPIAWLQIAIGILLVLFGMRWLRKAVLRASGAVPLRNEAAAYSSEIRDLQRRVGIVAQWDVIGVATSFKAVMLEGVEVVFIVIALGAVGNALVPASIGAIAAGILVTHRANAPPSARAGAGKRSQIRRRHHAFKLRHVLAGRRLWPIVAWVRLGDPRAHGRVRRRHPAGPVVDPACPAQPHCRSADLKRSALDASSQNDRARSLRAVRCRWRFTLALVAWIAIAGAIPILLERNPGAGALLLFAGFAAILVENLVHVASSGPHPGIK